MRTTFSRGQDSMSRIAEAAERLGLRRMCIVAEVRESTPSVVDQSVEARLLDAAAGLEVASGIEAQILDTFGEVEPPRDFAAAKSARAHLRSAAVADRTDPGGRGAGPGPCLEIRAATAVRWVTEAIVNALEADAGASLSRPFGVLERIGIPLAAFGADRFERIFDALARSGAMLEVSERWRDPGPASAAGARRAGLTMAAASGSDRASRVGRCVHCSYVAQMVGDGFSPSRRSAVRVDRHGAGCC